MIVDRSFVLSFVAALAIHGVILTLAAGAAVSELVRERSISVDVDFEVPSEPVVVEPARELTPTAVPETPRLVRREQSADIVVPDDDDERQDEGATLDFFDADESTFSFRGGVSGGTQLDGDGPGAAQREIGAAPPVRDVTRVSQARPVSLSARQWDCPWPEEADDLGIHRQTVTLRAVVDPAGRAQQVSVLSDPGYGFGEAAQSCAESVRFSPALDDAGDAILATSPPIRVRFSR